MWRESSRRLIRVLAAFTLTIGLVLLVSGCGGSGGGDSDPDAISEQNRALGATPDGIPGVVARTGPIERIRVGETAVLDGSKSSATPAEPVSFDWSFSSRPDASTAILQDPTIANPSFVADVRGTYAVQLVVSADGVSSKRAISVVVASVPPEPNVFHHGLSSNCVNCHNEDFPDIPEKISSHVATSNTCETCHSPLGFSVVTFVDHLEIFGNCSGCHNGTQAVGKSEFHTPTNAECDDCHNTTHFLALAADGSFDHSGIVRSCSGCHNGTLAPGISASPPHPDTQSECGECHTTASFQGAFPDHSGPEVLGSRCDSCHGVNAAGQTAGHPITSVDCGTCHSTATFSLGGVFNHRAVEASVQPCASCHTNDNSIGAPGKSSAVPAHPATSEDCGVCHNTDSFAEGVFDHSGIVDDCASCHGVTAGGKPTNHMPTTEDCSICHTPGSFSTGSYDHFGVVNDCAFCHDNVITIGKLDNHLPTTEDCVVCHDTVDFQGAIFGHVGIDTGNCAACHDGSISPGKPGDHVPTDLDCSDCHDISDFSSFAGILYSHAGIDPSNCAGCHASGIATAKTANHIPTQDDCSTCHEFTDSFAFSNFFTTAHPDITEGCGGCHTSEIFPTRAELVKGSGHLPTEQDCNVCHTNVQFAPSVFDHVGISSDCASCHDGSSAYTALGARGATATPTHQNTSGDCSVCHGTSDFRDAFVDHAGPEVVGNRCDSCHDGMNATGKSAKADHVVTSQDCAVCHVPGGAFAPAVFDHTGITDGCASCHNGIDATGKDAKIDPSHIPTNQDCSVCHTPTSFANAQFDHQGIVDDCGSCHNGLTAPGKSGNHVPTNSDCVDCHVTTGFLPATFDHAGINDNCASCHAAGFATGKGSDHLPTNQDCGVCHSPAGFVPATFDHTGITDNCSSCHGVSAIGMPASHVSTSLDCAFCHTTATFAGGTFDHQGITDGCSTCHDGVTAIGSEPQGPNDHFVTSAECNACHATGGWAPIDFVHPGNSGYPGDHNGNVGCLTCHDDNNENIAYRWNQYAPFCAACHANDFERKGDHIGGENGTVQQNRDCSGGGRGCHRVSDRKFD